jgi:hypothetical protein
MAQPGGSISMDEVNSSFYLIIKEKPVKYVVE